MESERPMRSDPLAGAGVEPGRSEGGLHQRRQVWAHRRQQPLPARGQHHMPRPARTNSGAPTVEASRLSAALTAGWVR